MVPIKTRLDSNDHYDGGNTKEYLVIHDTGNDTDSDEGNANYFCTGTRNASAHYFVDDNSITQVVKDDDCSFHCGDGHDKYGIGNRNSIGIEQCRVNNTVTATTESNTIELVKALMIKYNIPASKVVRHYDASRKICPRSFSANNWARWTEFKAKLVQAAPIAPVVSPVGELYRVRKTWEDIRSQVGAFTILDSAKKCADSNTGYEVYNMKGKMVYPVSSPLVPASVPAKKAQDTLTSQVDAGKKYVGNKCLELQQKLNKVMSFELDEDGIFGASTYGALIAFQKKYGLVQDGLAGNNTFSKLTNLIPSKPRYARILMVRSPMMIGDDIKFVQTRLTDLGYRCGAIDGKYGSNTATAVKQFQKTKRVSIDGIIGPQTWGLL